MCSRKTAISPQLISLKYELYFLKIRRDSPIQDMQLQILLLAVLGVAAVLPHDV